MGKFIELRFGQGDLGRSLIKKDEESHEYFVQREIVPVRAIQDMFVILPDKRNIQITWKIGKRQFTRIEYYKNTIDCIKRWCMLRKACGITSRDLLKNPLPLPMDAEDARNEKK